MEELGIPYNEDPNNGNPVGCSIIPSSMTAEKQSREDPRNAYLDPVRSRPNLHILTGHTAARVLHDNVTIVHGSTRAANSSGLLVTGVEVISPNPTTLYPIPLSLSVNLWAMLLNAVTLMA